MNRYCLQLMILQLVLIAEAVLISIFMCFNGIQNNAIVGEGRTLTRQSIMSLRSCAAKLDSCTRSHIVSLGMQACVGAAAVAD